MLEVEAVEVLLGELELNDELFELFVVLLLLMLVFEAVLLLSALELVLPKEPETVLDGVVEALPLELGVEEDELEL